jgi:acetyl-CoA carboxylase biotin carboxyl carrier protein
MKSRPNAEASSPTLEELLGFATEAALSEVVWEKDGRRIAFKRFLAPVTPAPTETAEAPVSTKNFPEQKLHLVKSPMVGTFLRAPKGRPPMVIEGDAVAPGHRLGIVEAMQVPKDVIATVKGKVLRVLVENGRPVEYGQPIVEIDVTEGA